MLHLVKEFENPIESNEEERKHTPENLDSCHFLHPTHFLMVEYQLWTTWSSQSQHREEKRVQDGNNFPGKLIADGE